jgi:hypothetical protein
MKLIMWNGNHYILLKLQICGQIGCLLILGRCQNTPVVGELVTLANHAEVKLVTCSDGSIGRFFE